MSARNILDLPKAPIIERTEDLYNRELGFGTYFAPHMAVMRFSGGEWSEHQTIPYQNLCMDPATKVLHYAESGFEGMKSFSNNIFRPYEHAKRFNRTLDRLCIPEIEEDKFIGALDELIIQNHSLLPNKDGYFTYIRPFILGITPTIRVGPSDEFLFLVIMSPSSPYMDVTKPISVHATEDYKRAVKGGTGGDKMSAGYSLSLKPLQVAKSKGCQQVLFLDSRYNKFLEELAAMNVYWIRKEKEEFFFETPSIKNGTILDGITRKSIKEALEDERIREETGLSGFFERDIAITEFIEGIGNGKIVEAGCNGTASVITPIGEVEFRGKKYPINNGERGEFTEKLYNFFTDIQYRRREDIFGWLHEVQV